VQHETQRVRKDGRTIDVSLTISPVYQEDGSIMGASTIVRDISAQKAEERLRDLEMKYQGLVNNINVGVYRSTGDPRGRFIWGNTSLIHILGYNSLDDLKEIAVCDFFARSTGREELLTELKQHGFVKNMEITLRRGDGRIIHVLVTALATFNPDGSISHINGIVEDISDQRLLEQKVANLYHLGTDQNLLPTL
jgi:PAS domain S-box-containing protein